MQLDVQKVINQLAQRIAQLETEKAIAQVQLDVMATRIQELETSEETQDPAEAKASPGGKIADKAKG